jgi:Ran GTPase-activating protein (RanGAP) involved in mRNA processing and transport
MYIPCLSPCACAHAQTLPIFALHCPKILERNELVGDAAVSKMAAVLADYFFAHHSKLAIISLSNVGITDASAVPLGRALVGNNTIERLYLSWNRIRDAGGVAIGDGLRQNSKLKELYLGDNYIGDIGGKHLAESLRETRTLEVGLLILSSHVRSLTFACATCLP